MEHGYDNEPTARDLDLARRLAEGSLPVSSSDDAEEKALLAELSAWREEHQTLEVPARTRERLWAGIVDATDTSAPTTVSTPRTADVSEPAYATVRRPAASRPVMLRLVSHPVFRYSVAAVFVLVAVVTLLRPSDTWREVARSGGGIEVYTSPDGSRITLRANSVLSADGSRGRTYRLVGEAFFDVIHDASAPFSVAAGDALVSVLGTRFDVATWSGSTEVYLESGSVRFESASSGASVVLAPGQRSVLRDGGPAVPEAGVEEDALDWMSGALSFSSRPLSNVVAELEQHFGLHISVPAGMEAELLSGRVLLVDPEAALEDLGTVLGGRFVSSGEGRYRYEP